MNYKRACIVAIIVFLGSLMINAVYGNLLGVDWAVTLPSNLPNEMWFITIASAAMLSIVGSFAYFGTNKIKTGFLHGLRFGIIISVFAIILDIFVLGIQPNGVEIVTAYFTKILYWLVFILIILVSGIVGFVRSKVSEFEL
jgi:hypothetical protein